MKRIASIGGLIFFSALALSAAVWDGSAVAGVAGDFPDDGYYGACNSFPRDTSVTVTNLENGKSVTVMITRNVDNPGIFIALSPKAAAELGMRAGSATRIRAVALVASQAESSLPPTRAGESADPDYNPKVYVEREKAAVAAAAAAPPAAPLASAPAAPLAVTPAPAPAPAAPRVAPTAKPETPSPESAEVLAKIGEPKKQPAPGLPELNEPKTAGVPALAPAVAAATPAPAVATPAPKAATPAPVVKPKPSKLPADALPMPEASPAFPGSPRPSPLGMSLPTPDAPSLAPSPAPTAYGGYLAMAPEVVGGETKPSPRKSSSPRLVFIEPPLPGPVGAAAAKAPGKTAEKASVDALKRPSARKAPSGVTLAEPIPGFAPEELPDAVLSRVTAPAKLVPNPMLAEAEAPMSLGDLRTKPEAIGFDKPSYAEALEAALLEASILAPAEAYARSKPAKAKGEDLFSGLSEAELPGSPDAISDRRTAGENEALSELQVPDVPRPVEGIAAERPLGIPAVAGSSALEEPGVSTPTSTGRGPTAIADLKKGPPQSSVGELSDPNVPSPTESLIAGKAKSVEPGKTYAELAEPDPNGKGVAAIGGAKPSKVPTPGAGELASPGVPNPSESIAAEHPAVIPGGEKTFTLEPATPRPPAAMAITPPAAAQGQKYAVVPTVPAPPKPVGPDVSEPRRVPKLKGLAKDSLYVQIGAYRSIEAFNGAVAKFKSDFRMANLPPDLVADPLAFKLVKSSKGELLFGLFVGPLHRDESGVVLINIRYLGYKGAYLLDTADAKQEKRQGT